nr:hypothetical protein [Fibrobacterota bacterium]
NTHRSQMPPVATFEVNLKATALIERWIREMRPLALIGLGSHAARGVLALPQATFQGRTLAVSRESLRGNPRVSMASVDGREIRLEKISEGLYAVPPALPKGLYFIRIGGKSLLRFLL